MFGIELRISYGDALRASQFSANSTSLLLKEEFDNAIHDAKLVLIDLAGKANPGKLGPPDMLSLEKQNQLSALLQDKRGDLHQLGALYLIWPGHQRLCLSDSGVQSTDPMLQKINETLLSAPGLDQSFSQPVITPGKQGEVKMFVGQRTLGEDKAYQGMVAAMVRIDYFSELALHHQSLDESVFALVDTDGKLIASVPDNIGGSQLGSANDYLAGWLDGRTQDSRIDDKLFDLKWRAYSIQRLDELPFLVVVGLPASAFFANWGVKAISFFFAWITLAAFMFASIWRDYQRTQLKSALNESQRRNTEREQHVRRLVTTLTLPLAIIWQRSHRIELANRACQSLLMRDEETLQGTALSDLMFRPEHLEAIDKSIREDGVVSDYELRMKGKSGQALWVSISAAAIELNGQAAYFAALTDISERKATQETLWRRATIDPLTGISNRGYFMERAQSEWMRASRYHQPLGLLMIDLDFFKKINDEHGHDAGDVVLQAAASALQNTLRDSDILGRQGGEEFVVLLVHQNGIGTADAARRARLAVEAMEVKSNSGVTLKVTASIGYALDEGCDDLAMMMRRADVALYAAKHAGRNCCVAWSAELDSSGHIT